MRHVFRQYGLFDPSKRGKLPNVRAPDDSLAYEDDGPAIVRSPNVGQWIEAYIRANCGRVDAFSSGSFPASAGGSSRVLRRS
jgi:hypothetical protein